MQTATDEVLGPLLTTAAVSYLPVENSPVLTLAAYQAGRLIGPMVREILSIPSRLLAGWGWRSVIIESDNSLYHSFEEYIIKHYIPSFRQTRLEPKHGDITYDLRDAILAKPIKAQHKGYTIDISIGQPPSQQNKYQSSNFNLTLSSRAPMDVIRDFVSSTCEHQDRTNTQVLRIFCNSTKNSGKDKKDRFVYWSKVEIFTNRNLGNTILDEAVEKELLDDVKDFISSRDWHNRKGIPFKRGFVLTGPPGTGKTSIVKAMAVEYDLPIFALDLSTIESNTELTELIKEINYLAKGQNYILSMEDVDRCRLFSYGRHHNYEGEPSKITKDCFLGVLDGVAESHGRTLIMSTNDMAPLEAIPALLRPGRVDKVVKINFVTDNQLQRMIAGFYDDQEIPKLNQLKAPSNLSPAQVIHIMRTHREDAQGAIKKLMSSSANLPQAILETGLHQPLGRSRRRRKATPINLARKKLTQTTKLLDNFDRDKERLEKKQNTLQQQIEKMKAAEVKKKQLLKEKKAAKKKTTKTPANKIAKKAIPKSTKKTTKLAAKTTTKLAAKTTTKLAAKKTTKKKVSATKSTQATPTKRDASPRRARSSPRKAT